MGWLFMRSIAPHHMPREYLNAQFTHTSETMTRTVLRSALVKMRTYYAALESLRPVQRREVVGIVGLIKYSKRDRGATYSDTRTCLRTWGRASPNARSRSSIC